MVTALYNPYKWFDPQTLLKQLEEKKEVKSGDHPSTLAEFEEKILKIFHNEHMSRATPKFRFNLSVVLFMAKDQMWHLFIVN